VASSWDDSVTVHASTNIDALTSGRKLGHKPLTPQPSRYIAPRFAPIAADRLLKSDLSHGHPAQMTISLLIGRGVLSRARGC
jgi:hypothetical protein